MYLANVRAVGEMVDGPGSAGVTGGEGVEGWVGNELSFRSGDAVRWRGSPVGVDGDSPPVVGGDDVWRGGFCLVVIAD